MATAIDSDQARIPVFRWRAAWDDDWTTVPVGLWSCANVTAGVLPRLGSATIQADYTMPGNREQDAPAWQDLVIDAFVQIGAWLPTPGEDPQADGADTRWLWTGFLAEPTVSHEGSDADNRVMRYTLPCEGLLSLFQRITLRRGRGKIGAALVDLPLLPVFNPDGRGNRITVGSEAGFDLVGERTATVWTARQVLVELLAWLDATGPDAWPTFTLSGQLGCLDYPVHDLALEGRTLLDAVLTLCAPARGVSVRPVPSDTSEVRLEVMSTSPTALALPGFTLAAASRVVTLAADRAHHRLVHAGVGRARRWRVTGRRVLTTLTLHWASAWDGDPAYGLMRGPGWVLADDAKAGDRDPRYASVFRCWRLNPGWNGKTFKPYGGVDTGIAVSATTDSDGLTGARPDWATGTLGLAPACRLVPHLTIPTYAIDAAGAAQPLSAWFGATAGVTLDPAAPRAPARILVGDAAGLSGWIDISGDVQVTITNDPFPMIKLGGDSPAERSRTASRLKALLTGKTMAVTLSIEEPIPFSASIEPSGAVVDHESTISAQYQRLLDSTVLGLKADGTLDLAPGPRTLVDGLPALQAARALIAPYVRRGGQITWSDGLDLHSEADERAEGAVVTTVTSGSDAWQVAGIITQRTWSFTKSSYGTTLIVESLPIDPAAVL